MQNRLITASPALGNHFPAALGQPVVVTSSLWELSGAVHLQEGVCVWVDVDNQDEELLARLCKGHFGKVRVIVLSSTPSDAQAVRWLGEGAAGYAHAFAAPEVVQQIAAVVGAGGLWVGVELMQQLCVRFGQLAKPDSLHLEVLSEREREVVDHLRQGKSNKLIARDLDITERTVKAHLSAIFHKLGVPDRVQLLLKLSA